MNTVSLEAARALRAAGMVWKHFGLDGELGVLFHARNNRETGDCRWWYAAHSRR